MLAFDEVANDIASSSACQAWKTGSAGTNYISADGHTSLPYSLTAYISYATW